MHVKLLCALGVLVLMKAQALAFLTLLKKKKIKCKRKKIMDNKKKMVDKMMKTKESPTKKIKREESLSLANLLLTVKILHTPSAQEMFALNVLKVNSVPLLQGVQALRILLQTRHVLQHAPMITMNPLMEKSARNVMILVLSVKLKKQWSAMKKFFKA